MLVRVKAGLLITAEALAAVWIAATASNPLTQELQMAQWVGLMPWAALGAIGGAVHVTHLSVTGEPSGKFLLIALFRSAFLGTCGAVLMIVWRGEDAWHLAFLGCAMGGLGAEYFLTMLARILGDISHEPWRWLTRWSRWMRESRGILTLEESGVHHAGSTNPTRTDLGAHLKDDQ